MSQVISPELQSFNIASLYVGDLRPEVTEQILWNAFSSYGQVLSVKICRNSQTQASLGYGYVNYRTHVEAEKALKAVNFSLIEGRPCRVMWSMRDPAKRKCNEGNLFIKNIDPVLDTKSLYEAFSAFGQVMSCKIAIDDYGLSKGYGFIQFYNEKDAEEARKKSDGVAFMKKKIVVTKFIPKSNRTDAKTVDPNQFTNIFVKSLPKTVILDQFKKLFEKFGEITSFVIQANSDEKEQLNYGFINYAQPESALAAIKHMDGYEMPDKTKLTVCKAMKKLERTAFLKRQYEERKKAYLKKIANMNLYVKNFDESFDDEKLKEIFKEFGKIQSAHVMRDDSGKSRGFGFVCFSTVNEASVALNAMNLKMINDKPLYVAIAQSRDERKRALEMRNYENSFRPPVFAPTMPIMYPQPAPIAFHPRYQGFPRQHPRPFHPSGGSGAPVQNFHQQNTRGGYANYNSGHFRQRAPLMNHHQSGVIRAGASYSSRVHHVQAQGAVNAVITDQTVKVSKEPTKSAKASYQDSRITLKDNVIALSNKFAKEKGYDSSASAKVAGIVHEYLNNSQQVYDESDIISSIKDVYNSLLHRHEQP